jgi:5,5'-dehydrodivanillate O-demethylase
MLSEAENQLLTGVGPDTRMGALLRRYWWPIATVNEMDERWTKRVRLLGEDLVLFRDRSGTRGLIAEACPHRRASLAYGIPTEGGIRCPYHGWAFDRAGRCVDQPNEPVEDLSRAGRGSTFKDRIRTAAYPVGELAGLIWAYLGPAPVPLIPRLDGLVAEGAIRTIGTAVVECNWIQAMENSLDPVHTEWLHGALFEFARERAGDPASVGISRHVIKIGFDEFEYGIIKRKVSVGQSEEDDEWKIGHPMVFPNVLAIGNASEEWRDYRFEFRVPIDETKTLYFWYGAFVPPPWTEANPELFGRVHTYDVPLRRDGEYLVDMVHAQDILAWETQGTIMDRSAEHLGAQDRGVIMYRKMLVRELERMEAGEDPKNVFRDPATNQCLDLPVEGHRLARVEGFESMFRRMEISFSPIADELVDIFTKQPPPAAIPDVSRVGRGGR